MPELVVPAGKTGESKTAIQSVAMIRDIRLDRTDQAVLSKHTPATYRTYRKIRKHPTVALTRAWAIAVVMSGEWSVEVDDGVPDDLTAFVRKQIMRWREFIVENAMAGNVDFGWTPFELVWGSQNIDGRQRVVLQKVKSLLVDLTDIVLRVPHGDYAGLRQLPIQSMAAEVWLDDVDTLLVSWRVEGQEYYGEGLLENARLPYSNWQDANGAADRYDQKIAGAHWVIQYPVGVTPINGADVDNYTLACQFAEGLQSSGAIVVPLQITRALTSLNDAAGGSDTAWKIELRDHVAQQTAFGARLEYLDKQLVRSILTTERAVMEGTHGTLAEADAHSDVPILIRDQEHRHITKCVTDQVVRPLVRLNAGEAMVDKVRLIASPLSDAKIAFFRDVFKLLVANPSLVIDLVDQTDTDALLDAIDWPKAHEIANMPSVNPNASTPPIPQMTATREMAARIQSLYRASMQTIDEGNNGDGHP